jgi:hypothetical protein
MCSFVLYDSFFRSKLGKGPYKLEPLGLALVVQVTKNTSAVSDLVRHPRSKPFVGASRKRRDAPGTLGD